MASIIEQLYPDIDQWVWSPLPLLKFDPKKWKRWNWFVLKHVSLWSDHSPPSLPRQECSCEIAKKNGPKYVNKHHSTFLLLWAVMKGFSKMSKNRSLVFDVLKAESIFKGRFSLSLARHSNALMFELGEIFKSNLKIVSLVLHWTGKIADSFCFHAFFQASQQSSF